MLDGYEFALTVKSDRLIGKLVPVDEGLWFCNDDE